jgi:hypothetical protein
LEAKELNGKVSTLGLLGAIARLMVLIAIWGRMVCYVVVLDSFATAHAASHIGMCPHKQRERPPPSGGESEGGIKETNHFIQ